MGALLMFASFAYAGRGNPFELDERLPPVENEEIAALGEGATPDEPSNPFNVRYRSVDGEYEREDVQLVARETVKPVLDARGKLLGIHIGMLVILGILWSTMRPTLTSSYRSLFNSSVAWQMYRRKSGGLRSRLLLGYAFSVFAIGFFAYLLTQYFELLPGNEPWMHFGLMSAGVAGVLGLKHLLLSTTGWLWEASEETSRYGFSVMMSAIVLGMFLVPANLFISYAPENITHVMVYGTLALGAAIFGLRWLRGLDIGNSVLGKNPMLFLLYICAVEIAPVALLAKFIYEQV